MANLEKIVLSDKFAAFDTYWDPKVAGELNGQQVRLAKLKGDFVWHSHEHEDELFLVVKGHLRIELRDGHVALGPGEMVIVPRGVEHRPVADEEVHVVLFEPAETRNTGQHSNERTVSTLDRI
ncbi:MAG: cupin domain-containing protein [Pirellulaceae bacterium]